MLRFVVNVMRRAIGRYSHIVLCAPNVGSYGESLLEMNRNIARDATDTIIENCRRLGAMAGGRQCKMGAVCHCAQAEMGERWIKGAAGTSVE